jgi:hypothetical protein
VNGHLLRGHLLRGHLLRGHLLRGHLLSAVATAPRDGDAGAQSTR